MEHRHATGAEVRLLARAGNLDRQTSGLAMGYVQANLVAVPKKYAFDLLLFCQRNPRPCPLLDVVEAGRFDPPFLAPGADIRTDVPRYRVFEKGTVVEEPADVVSWWKDDMVGFLLGCSFTFEKALMEVGVPVRHVETKRNVPMYKTNLLCRPAGIFRGPMVVSMRPMTPGQAIRAVEVCSRYPRAHGAPIHLGDPSALGIADLDRPDYGDPPTMLSGEIPVFWACGVTPQAVAVEAQPSLLITHKPGCMFVGDLRDADLEGAGN
ncbi:MAG: putative hydro-lyase [Gemmataceae bacterium]|nr:putative hydro-lyase [Gemmataceae bacterium]